MVVKIAFWRLKVAQNAGVKICCLSCNGVGPTLSAFWCPLLGFYGDSRGQLAEVMFMRVHEILKGKGDSVYQISPDATMAEAVDRLVKFNIGSLLVTDGESIVGIITERDVLKAIAGGTKGLGDLVVENFMTKDLVTGNSNDEVGEIMGMMTSHRVRHLPIIDDERLAGMISIGDVVKSQYELLAVENHYLRVYIQS